MKRIPFLGNADGVLEIWCRPARSSSRSRDDPRSSRPHTFPPLSTTSGRRSSPSCAQATTLGDSRLRPGQFRQRSAPPVDQLQGAALCRVRAPELVGVLGGADPLARVRQVPRRRADPHAGGRQGPGDERPDRRHDPPCSCCSTSPDPGQQVDRVLNGPTNDVWMDPWLAHLRSWGSDYRTEHQVQAIHTAGGAVTDVSIVADGGALTDTADFYVAALPVEVMRILATDEIKQAEPRLAGLNLLRTRWMNGVMFYLDRDVPMVHGHSLYVDSLWALPRSPSGSSGPGWTSSGWATDEWRGFSPSTSPTGRRRATTASRPCTARARRCARRSGPSSSGASTTPGSTCWRMRTCSTRSSTRTSCTRTRPRRRTSSRCWSTPRARGTTAPRRRRRSRTSSSPPTTFAPTPTWPRWRARTRRPGGPSTGSWSGQDPRSPDAPCGRSRSPRSSLPRGRLTAFCSLSTVRPSWRSAPRGRADREV